MHFLVMQKPKYTIPYHYDMYNVQCNSIYEKYQFLRNLHDIVHTQYYDWTKLNFSHYLLHQREHRVP